MSSHWYCGECDARVPNDESCFRCHPEDHFNPIIDELKAENATLREALEFYAQRPKPDITSTFAKSAAEWNQPVCTWEPLTDLGKIARIALGEESQEATNDD